MTLRDWLGGLALTCCLCAQAAPRSEVLSLHYRSADEFKPLIQDLLGDEGHVGSYGNQLVVSAEPGKLAELRELLQQLDTPPKRLLISVDSNQAVTSRHDGYRLDGSASIGGVEVVSGAGERHGRDQLRIIRRSSQDNRGSLQQVQTTEGYPALIQVGQQLPLTLHERNAYGISRETTEYREINRGFEVLASVQGEQVVLSIRSQQNRLAGSHGVIDTQSTDTRVSGRLGQWIEVGNIAESRGIERPGLASREVASSRQNHSLRLKVELLP